MCAVAAENFVANTVAVSAACVQMMLTDACVVDMCCCCMGVVALYIYIMHLLLTYSMLLLKLCVASIIWICV